MRTAMFIMVFLLLSASASAFSTTSIVQGTEPVVYGNIVAFLTFEDFINHDLNNDGDQADRVLQYYDIRAEKVTNTGNAANQLTLAGKLIAYGDKNRAIQFYDIENKKGDGTQERGTAPSVYGSIIAFTTSEKDAARDLNDDGDQIDDIIQYHDAGKDALTNTKAVGTDPLALSGSIAFSTNEGAVEEDLNDDGDRDDTIIRYVNIDDDDIINTELTGEHLVGYKLDTIIVADNDHFATIKLLKHEKNALNVFGNNPSLYQDLLVYDRDGTLYAYRLSTGVEQSLNITGTDPALFDDVLAFIDEDRTIAIIQGEDPDNDNVPDFADNCPDQANENQADADKDGLGTACDDTPLPEEKKPEPAAPQVIAQVTEPPIESLFTTQAGPETPPAVPVERKAIPDTLVLQREKDDRGPTSWFFIVVGLAVVGILLYFFVPRWLHKRKKSYGF